MYEVHKDNTKIRMHQKVVKNDEYDMSIRKVFQTDEEYVNNKIIEVEEIFKKYSIINDKVRRSITLSYLRNQKIKSGSMKKIVELLEYILKTAYSYTDEEFSEFLRKNANILKASYGDFRCRLAIFNRFGLLEDVIFKGNYYLGYEFEEAHFGTRSLYAIMVKNNITSLEELNELVDRTPEKELAKLRKKYQLTEKEIKFLDEELQKRVKVEARHREFERRRALKTQK